MSVSPQQLYSNLSASSAAFYEICVDVAGAMPHGTVFWSRIRTQVWSKQVGVRDDSPLYSGYDRSIPHPLYVRPFSKWADGRWNNLPTSSRMHGHAHNFREIHAQGLSGQLNKENRDRGSHGVTKIPVDLL